ncbi:hypothetical protein F0562_015941 [Nyssa sinensis]|uniref:Late embryogenesis abundant protein LEA-2 subgroup domain-containing protein n=1 Tax=Nyssa sinensis TaxID=561372 RepID=A0A5J4ZML7_9ASTE|nr:hypothetical protein F0562_015941 [Nyssa sinensis]
MASTSDEQNKPVIGYPAQPGQVATGYPQFAPPTNSAHPYAAAPPPPSAFYTTAVTAPYQNYPDRLLCSSFLRCLIVTVLTVFLIMGAVFFIVWLVLRPRLPEFRVASASVSPLNATASELTATWDFSILVTNPNGKLTVFYDRLDTTVFYGDDFLLSQTELPPFSQTKKNQTILHARLAVDGANVGDDVARSILGDRNRGSELCSIRLKNARLIYEELTWVLLCWTFAKSGFLDGAIFVYAASYTFRNCISGFGK